MRMPPLPIIAGSESVSVERCIVPNMKLRLSPNLYSNIEEAAVLIVTAVGLDLEFGLPLAEALYSQSGVEFEVEFYALGHDAIGHVQIMYLPHLDRACVRLNMPLDNKRTNWEWTDATSGDDALWRFETGGMESRDEEL